MSSTNGGTARLAGDLSPSGSWPASFGASPARRPGWRTRRRRGPCVVTEGEMVGLSHVVPPLQNQPVEAEVAGLDDDLAPPGVHPAGHGHPRLMAGSQLAARRASSGFPPRRDGLRVVGQLDLQRLFDQYVRPGGNVVRGQHLQLVASGGRRLRGGDRDGHRLPPPPRAAFPFAPRAERVGRDGDGNLILVLEPLRFVRRRQLLRGQNLRPAAPHSSQPPVPARAITSRPAPPIRQPLIKGDFRRPAGTAAETDGGGAGGAAGAA